MSESELPITPGALRTYMSDENDDLDPFLAVANIAAPVVAAELRRIAAGFDYNDPVDTDAEREVWTQAAALLRGRANLLHAEEDG